MTSVNVIADIVHCRKLLKYETNINIFLPGFNFAVLISKFYSVLLARESFEFTCPFNSILCHMLNCCYSYYRNRDYLDDDGNGVYVDNYFEDEYNKDFKNRKGKKGQKIREKPARSFKRSSRYREDEFGKYNDPDKEMARWEDEEDNDFKRPKEKKNTFKDQQFRDKPASAVNKSNIYKGIKFDEHQIPDSVAARWEPPVDRPAMRNTAKVDTSKLAPFEKNFYQLHPDTKNFSDVSSSYSPPL